MTSRRQAWARKTAAVFAEYGGLCVYCLEPAHGVDHIVPKSQGGGHRPENLVPACKSCNESKADLPLIIWLATRGNHEDFKAAARAHPAVANNTPLTHRINLGGWALD